jgi:hypothetical protein
VRYLVPIVEGQSEVDALPALLHRMAQTMNNVSGLHINPPIRVKAGSFLYKTDYFSQYIQLAAAKAAQDAGTVLILLDCEDECPAKRARTILDQAKAVRGDVPYLVVLVVREYETWFVTAARSLRGLRGLPDDLEPPPDPQIIRNAKGWLGERMRGNYDEIVHQLEFTKKFDLDAARANASFDRFYRKIAAFLSTP